MTTATLTQQPDLAAGLHDDFITATNHVAEARAARQAKDTPANRDALATALAHVDSILDYVNTHR